MSSVPGFISKDAPFTELAANQWTSIRYTNAVDISILSDRCHATTNPENAERRALISQGSGLDVYRSLVQCLRSLLATHQLPGAHNDISSQDRPSLYDYHQHLRRAANEPR